MKIGEGLTKWDLVPLWTIIKTNNTSQTKKIKKQPKYATQKMQGITLMGLCDPWTDTYLNNCKLEQLEELTISQYIY